MSKDSPRTPQTLRCFLDQKGVGVKELAKILEINGASLHNKIAGRRPLTEEESKQLASRLGGIGHRALLNLSKRTVMLYEKGALRRGGYPIDSVKLGAFEGDPKTLADLMYDAEISRKELALASGVAGSTISSLKKGNLGVGSKTAKALSAVLGVSPDVLIASVQFTQELAERGKLDKSGFSASRYLD